MRAWAAVGVQTIDWAGYDPAHGRASPLSRFRWKSATVFKTHTSPQQLGQDPPAAAARGGGGCQHAESRTAHGRCAQLEGRTWLRRSSRAENNPRFNSAIDVARVSSRTPRAFFAADAVEAALALASTVPVSAAAAAAGGGWARLGIASQTLVGAARRFCELGRRNNSPNQTLALPRERSLIPPGQSEGGATTTARCFSGTACRSSSNFYAFSITKQIVALRPS